MTPIVLDASVVLKWFLGDEEGRAQAIALRDAIVRGDLEPHAPTHLSLEVGAGLVRATRRGRAVPEAVPAALDALAQMAFRPVEVASVTGEAADIALNLGISVHDAAYLAVGTRVGATVVTADERVHAVASAAGHDVVRLKDLPVASG